MNELTWWQRGVIYQIYPRSFQDSDGDGVGDLRGIASRLDHLEGIGVDAVWISPIYPSPMYDFGYDVADYTGIDPLFGTMADFDRLLDELHRRDLRLILDLVPNHTSAAHPWFVESRSSRESPKRDWYIWADPGPDGGPPNNWLSFFGGPAWTYDEGTGQYYLHQFVPQQPELNYRNPEVMNAMEGVMRFWLDEGVDGFRVDVLWLLVKDALLRDEPPNPDWDGVEPFASLSHIHTQDVEGIQDLVRRLRAVTDEYDERVLVGEIYLPYPRLIRYYGQKGDGCHLPFNFRLIGVPWTAGAVRALIEEYEEALPPGAWPNWVLGNHDQHRIATRIGRAQARVAQVLLLTLRGTPTCYYGDEIGMEDVPVPAERAVDPPARNQPEIAHIVGRDPERTPMQWDDSPRAGFTAPEVEPWLPLAEDFRRRNVAKQRRDPRSMLALFTALTSLRRREPALQGGELTLVESGDDEVLAFRRSAPGSDDLLVVLNFGRKAPAPDLSAVAERGVIEIATGMDRSGPVGLAPLSLRPNEGLVIRLMPQS